MRPFLRFLLALALLAFGSQAFASFPLSNVVSYSSSYNNFLANYGWFSSIDAACAKLASVSPFGSGYTAGTATFSSGIWTCHVIRTSTGGDTAVSMITQAASSCPANSTGTSTCTCNTGYDEAGSPVNSCVPHVNKCTATSGQPSIHNWTVGWQRTKNVSSTEPVLYPSMPSSGTKVCSGGCQVEIDPNAVGPGLGAYVDQVPTDQGLYRVSVDFVGKNSGTECTAGTSDAPVTPTTANPPCPGYVGDVNGVKGCYGTADKPVAPSANPMPSNTPMDAGNPAAGPKATSGEGSGTGGAGRTPSAAGTTASAGGPAAAAAGANGTGAGTGTVAGQSGGTGRVATQTGTEQANCGAPGQSACKIDESGTPGAPALDTSGLDAAKDATKALIDGAASMTAPAWTFSFSLPTGCTAYQVGQFKGVTFTMNPCAYQSTIHDLMSMIWAAVTAFCLIGMVGRTIRES